LKLTERKEKHFILLMVHMFDLEFLAIFCTNLFILPTQVPHWKWSLHTGINVCNSITLQQAEDVLCRHREKQSFTYFVFKHFVRLLKII